MTNHCALVLGASGITGWAIVNELLSDSPNAQCFNRVIALTNRPISPEVSRWPSNPKLECFSGINLLADDQDKLNALIKGTIPNVEQISHVFYNAYKFSQDKDEESTANTLMLERCVTAMESLSPMLQFVVMPTGGKTYGFSLLDSFPFKNQLPLTEDLPRIPEPHRSKLFYYWQMDKLKAMSTNKTWTYCEIRPDVVVGFVPQNNAHCLAQILAIYLSLYAHVRGSGSIVPFPGNDKSWTIRSNDSSQDIVARFSMYAALNPEKCGNGQAFNVADRAEPSTWSRKWPVICAYFGLKGTGPQEDAPQPGAFIKEHRDRWISLAKEKDLKLQQLDNEFANPGFQHYIMSLFTFDRMLSLDAIRKAGFEDECDEKTAWYTAFDRFREANIIP